MWFKNLFKKRKYYDIVDLKKVKSDYGPPQFTVYDHLTARVIALDTVQSFVIYEEDVKILHSIEEQGFSLEELNDNWWVCRRKKGNFV